MGISNKKRKASDGDEHESDYDHSSFNANKLCLPRSTGIDYNQQAEFLPLPSDVNSALLATLGHDPFSSPASTFGVTELPSVHPSHAHAHEHKSSNASDYFSNQHAPFGILGPQVGASSDSMDEDHAFLPQRQRHGPHCKSIPQLSVRHNGGSTSELWANCLDCGAFTKVQSDKPANLCYSP